MKLSCQVDLYSWACSAPSPPAFALSNTTHTIYSQTPGSLLPVQTPPAAAVAVVRSRLKGRGGTTMVSSCLMRATLVAPSSRRRAPLLAGTCTCRHHA
eukprot:1160522-Pelagomonas_calceolata.AAC.4